MLPTRVLRLAIVTNLAYRPLLAAGYMAMGTNSSKEQTETVFKAGEEPKPELTFTEEQLRAKLSEEEYKVTQQKGIFF